MIDEMVEIPSIEPSASAGGCPQDVSISDSRWYVMRVTYSRELKAMQLLQKANVECYVPMLYVRDEFGKHTVPAVHNLIFVHTTRDVLDTCKRRMEAVCPLRYMMDKSTKLPMVVRNKEMEDFMWVTEHHDADIFYLDNPSVVCVKGTPIEVIGGPFKGLHGRLLRIRRNRKVVLQLVGLVAVAIDGIPIECCKISTKV